MQSQRIQQLLAIMRVIALMYFVAALAILFQSIFSIIQLFTLSSIIGAFWNNPGAAGGGAVLVERISSFFISANTVLLSPFLPPALIFKTYASSVIAGASLAGGQISFQQYLLNISVFVFFIIISFGLWKKWKWPLIVAGINAAAVIISSVFFLNGGSGFNISLSFSILKSVGFYADILIVFTVIMFIRAGFFKSSPSEKPDSILNRFGIGSFWSDVQDISELNKFALADMQPNKKSRINVMVIAVILAVIFLGGFAFLMIDKFQNSSVKTALMEQNNNSGQTKQNINQTQSAAIKATTPFNYKTTKLADVILGSDRNYVYYDSAKRQSFFVANGNIKWPAANGGIGKLVFSADYEHFAYTTGKSGKIVAVYDNTESKPYDSIDDLRISGDGEHYAFISKKDNEYFMVLDGREFKNRYRRIEYILKKYALSRDGSVVAYLAGKNQGETSLVINSDEIKVVRETEFGISQDGKLIAYTMKDENGFLYVVRGGDALQGGKYKEIWNLTFSPDGNHLAYMAQNKSNEVILVFDGAEQKIIDIGSHTARYVDIKKDDPENLKRVLKRYEYDPSLFFSMDNSTLAYRAVNEDQEYIIANNIEGKKYSRVTDPVFSLINNRMSYMAQIPKWKEGSFVVIDGSELGPYNKVQSPVFSPDGAHYTYIVNDLYEDYLVIDGIEVGKLGLKYDPVSIYSKRTIIYDNPIFSPDSRYAGCLKVINNGQLWWVVRPVVSLPDADNDGLADEEEARYETDENNPDTDGDGYKDGEEVRSLFNPKGSGVI